RAMALGDFFDAWRHYRQAQPSVAAEQRDTLASRLALAEGLLPRPPTTVTAAVTTGQLAGQPLAPLLNELHPAAVAAVASQFPATNGITPIPPRRFKLETKARFDGQVGQNAGRGEFRNVDAFGRQFAVAVDDRRIYLSNRFQVTAYDRESGQQHWAQA